MQVCIMSKARVKHSATGSWASNTSGNSPFQPVYHALTSSKSAATSLGPCDALLGSVRCAVSQAYSTRSHLGKNSPTQRHTRCDNGNTGINWFQASTHSTGRISWSAGLMLRSVRSTVTKRGSTLRTSRFSKLVLSKTSTQGCSMFTTCTESVQANEDNNVPNLRRISGYKTANFVVSRGSQGCTQVCIAGSLLFNEGRHVPTVDVSLGKTNISTVWSKDVLGNTKRNDSNNFTQASGSRIGSHWDATARRTTGRKRNSTTS
mmetsp:Transcript_3308/g.5507  ORF Transcript_3308/g.5507 Transcript_3308/m.5507 type:complete len:262 (-) Transcript_3308:1072-1857(-)